MVRLIPIPYWHLIPDVIGHSCTDTDSNTDTRGDVIKRTAHEYAVYKNTECVENNNDEILSQ